MSEDNIYTPPKADLTLPIESTATYEFFPTSKKKLTILFLTTFGAYNIYWFYKNWKIQQEQMDKKILPAMRAIFYIFFTHSLFSRIQQAATDKDVPMKWSSGLVATVLVILALISSLLDFGSNASETLNIADFLSFIVLLAMLFPVYYIQGIANEVNDDPFGELNNSFSIYNYIFIILGSALWLLILIGAMVPA